MFESQRLGFEKQIDDIDKVKDPALKLDKNKLLIQRRDEQAKLDAILADEKKMEDDQKFIIEKQQATTVPTERKGLEQSRWDLDKKIQDVEKKRWAVEKQIQEIDTRVGAIDESSEQLVIEKNGLQDKVMGVDKSLREIYSVVVAREEERRRGEAAEQVAKREAMAKIRAGQNETVQRQEWSELSTKKRAKEDEGYLSKAPKAVKERLLRSSEIEEEQRKKFVHDVENWTGSKEKKPTVEASQPVLPPPPVRRVVLPPPPPKKI